MIKRLISEKKQSLIELTKKYQNKKMVDLSTEEKEELIELIAKKLNLLQG